MPRPCACLSQSSLSALALSGAALAGNGGVAPVEPASPNAERINDSYYWVAIFTGAIFVLVQGSLILFIVRYRARPPRATEDGAQIHGNTRLELAWTVAPVLILVAIGAFVFYKLPGIRTCRARAPQAGASTSRSRATGTTGASRTRTASSRSTSSRPGRPDGQARRHRARLRRHPLLVDPRARRQDRRDPGHDERDLVHADAPGIYRGQCAELCGIQHAAMTAEVEALPRDEFEAWLDEEARRPGAGTSELGEETFTGACAKCHGLAARATSARARRATPPRRRRSLETGRSATAAALMPPVGKDWSERQIDALTDYLAGGGAEWRLDAETPVPAWQRGRVASWLVPRPQADRDPLHRHAASSSSRAGSWRC